MEVILLKNVDNLGEIGAVVTVARGYARNYLIPQGMAAIADERHKRIVVETMKQAKMQDQKAKRDAEGLAERMGELSCTISVQAGDDDKLFGSVTGRDIATSLSEQEIEVDHRQVELEEPIKQLGVYSVPVKLHAEVVVNAKVWVVKA
ncbi:MAG: 50S ribosomal protein L9 [bacterium]